MRKGSNSPTNLIESRSRKASSRISLLVSKCTGNIRFAWMQRTPTTCSGG